MALNDSRDIWKDGLSDAVSEGHSPTPERYSIARLTLTGFRSYERLRLEVDERPVILSGPNGAGKTNLLEAVSFLVPGRGLRNARLGEVAMRADGGQELDTGQPWAVAATVRTPMGPVDLGTGREPAMAANGRDRRAVRIDGDDARGQAALGEHLAAVWLTPRMDRLFVEGASARRRFIDRMVFGFDPAHAGRVSAFENAARERIRLLRGPQAADPVWLGALEETMAGRGVAITAARKETVARLAAFCEQPVGPFPGARIVLEGVLEEWLDEGPALAAEDRFRAALADHRRGDAESGRAAVGPHRSDLRVFDAQSATPAAQSSTGQQKALLIAIVLAGARMQAAERGRVPVLLLDEVAAHLDASRREALFAELQALGAQAWLAGTDVETFAPLRGTAQFFGIAEASVTPIG